MLRRDRVADPGADVVSAEIDTAAAVGEVLGLDEGVHVARDVVELVAGLSLWPKSRSSTAPTQSPMPSNDARFNTDGGAGFGDDLRWTASGEHQTTLMSRNFSRELRG